MARRHRGRGKPIELFPFLAILACVIGVLTLLIAGLSLGELEIDLSGVEFVQLQRQREQALTEIANLERTGEEAGIRLAQVKHMRGEVTRRENELEEARPLQEELAGLQARRDRAEAERDKLQEGLAALQRELAALDRALLGERHALDDQQVEIRGPKARPGQRRLRPRFIECRRNEVILDPDRGSSSPSVVVKASLLTSAAFRKLQHDVKWTAGSIVILLVREGGVDTYDLAAAILRQNEVRYGAMPVPSARKLDFSALEGER